MIRVLDKNNIYTSFVEEAVLNPDYCGYIGGRIEVYHPHDGVFHSEEIRFFTKNIEEFYIFRKQWDMKNVTSTELDFIRDIVKEMWYDV